MSITALTPGLRPGVLADRVPGAAMLGDALTIAAGAGATGLCAQIALLTPLSPVPFTLQTFAVLVVGAALGPMRGVAAMLLYVGVGTLGLPWFAGQSGGWHGHTFGYLLGSVLAAALVGESARRGHDRSVGRTLAAMATGHAVIYAVGALWLSASLHVGLGQSLTQGVVPFLVTDSLKIAAAAGILPLVWRILQRGGR
ncbi:biotin transporter BioY [Streptomyces sp. Inha503]|uniref:biotin transporter BioY n=1 Tax=Streptomyces sp. Inha503 TaxID=3383314 RepID=UPI0039A179E5